MEVGKEKKASLRELMKSYVGRKVMAAFEDDDVTEVYVNPQDNILRFGRHSTGAVKTDTRLEPAKIESFLKTVATYHRKSLHSKSPNLQAELPEESFLGARLQGAIPPVSQGPTFCIRKLATEIYPLDSYVENEIMSRAEREMIREAVRSHANILVIGATNSGKTTLCNALIKEMSDQYPGERLVILEDTGELQCSADDHLILSTWEEDGEGESMIDLVEVTLRYNPARILIGEVRDHSAYRLLDAWSSGHPGGCCTVHGDNVEDGLRRINRLARDAGVPDQKDFIGRAVDLICFIKGSGDARTLEDLARLDGYDGQEDCFRLVRA